MELSLTLDELFEIYASIKEQKTEDFKLMAKANGAEIKDTEQGDPSAFNKVVNQVKERKGEVPSNETAERKVGLFKVNSI